MLISRPAVAGTLESGDATVRITPHDSLEVVVTSSVEAQYGDAVRRVVRQTLEGLGVARALVTVTDKGALDYALRARVEAAVMRAGDEPVDWDVLIGGER
ncbi:MAG: citrate lyase acyl carrier protein [Propionibacteriaceae bacterium]|jgi:citrate lyase subunit gamma (acyl carrier protein)|nr:citrate lyase acyl carrier protein [Propionibacteriaceae bacterium]